MGSDQSSGIAKRLGAGVVSQALSMATNVVFVVGMARTLDNQSFGRLALLYGLVQISVGVVRSTTAEIAATKYSGEVREVELVRGHVARTALFRLAIALPLLVLASLLLFDGFTLPGMVLAVAVLPVGMHEIWRHLSFAALTPKDAVRLDLAWLVVGAGAWAVMSLLSIEADAQLTLAWASGAAAGWMLGHRSTRASSGSDGRLTWRQQSRRDGPAYAMEFVLSRGTPELVGWALAIAGGIAQAGSFRLAQTLLGPLSVVIGGLRGTFVGELRRLVVQGGRAFKAAGTASAVFALIPILYLLVLILVPDSFGKALVGNQWTAALAIAPYLALRRASSAAGIAPFLMLRLLGHAKRTTGIRLIEAAIAAASIIAGASIGGTTGALVGFVAAGAVSLMLWWVSALRARPTTEIVATEAVEKAEI